MSWMKLVALGAGCLAVALIAGCGDDDDAALAVPVVDDVTDETGDGIALIGENLTLRGVFEGVLLVRLDDVEAPVIALEGDTMTVRVPPEVGAGERPLVVENLSGISEPVSVEVRRLAYTADFADLAVSVLDVDGASVTPIGTVAVDAPPGPFAIAFTPDGRTAVIACGVGFLPDEIIAALAPGSPPGDSVAIVDVIAGETVAVIQVGEDSKPTGVAVHPDGNPAYVTNYAASTVSVIDLESNTLLQNIDVPRQPEEIAVRPDGQVLLVNSVGGTVTTIDVATLEILATVVTGDNDPSGVAWSADGRTGYVTHSFTDPSFEEDGTLVLVDLSNPEDPQIVESIADDIGPTPFDVDVSPLDGRLLVTNLNVIFDPISIGPGSVSLVDLSAEPPAIEVVAVGTSPIHGAFTDGGRIALVGNGLAQTVSVLSMESDSVLETVALGSTIGPSDVAVQP